MSAIQFVTQILKTPRTGKYLCILSDEGYNLLIKHYKLFSKIKIRGFFSKNRRIRNKAFKKYFNYIVNRAILDFVKPNKSEVTIEQVG